jgi:hypothetical protein
LGLSGLEQLRVACNVFGPKLHHYSLHVIEVKSNLIVMIVAELAIAQDSRIWILGGWCKGRTGRLMNDPARRNTELVSPD